MLHDACCWDLAKGIQEVILNLVFYTQGAAAQKQATSGSWSRGNGQEPDLFCSCQLPWGCKSAEVHSCSDRGSKYLPWPKQSRCGAYHKRVANKMSKWLSC